LKSKAKEFVSMVINEVRVFLKEGQDRKLKAYATLTFDKAFVVRNVKVIEGTKGLFVAMPSRRLKESCPKCNFKNAVRSKYCNQCGIALPQYVEPKPVSPADNSQRQSEHRDIAHPITTDFREYIQKKVLAAYEDDIKKGPTQPSAPQPSVSSRVNTMDEDDDIEL
jgi:stage V sporulation protein G